MHRLRVPFVVRALSNCKDYLKIKWADGIESTYPNSFLRASVRDAKYYDECSKVHLPEHFPFVSQGAAMAQAKQTDANNIEVTWDDHTSTYDVSWLRVQDEGALPSISNKVEWTPWEKNFSPPTYDYSEKDTKLDSWMADVNRYGLVVFHNVPRNTEGLRSVLHSIGPLQQRRHPTNEFYMRSETKNMRVDLSSYTPTALLCHMDHSYYKDPAKFIALLSAEYSAPERDTVSRFCNGSQLAEQLRDEDPESFELLCKTKVRLGRRRLTVEEECASTEVKKYEWDYYCDVPIILEEGGRVQTIRLHLQKHFGYPLITSNKDEKQMKKYYQAFDKFLQLIDNPENQIQFVLREGMMAVFDNHKIGHGRGPIYPGTKRYVIGGYIDDETWTSRWRIQLGRKTGLTDKWLLVCSQNALEVLSQRFEENSIGENLDEGTRQAV